MTLKELFSKRQKSTHIRPYIIAEAGVNHEGSMELAMRLIDEAKEGGADAIKFQSYKAETLVVEKSPAYWDLDKEATDSQFKLFKKYDKFWKNEYEQLKKHCEEVKIEFLSTPFDIESATFLNDLMAAYKISSSDITNKLFIEFICSFNKPVIISTGASYLHEIEEAVSWINKSGNELALLHCILNYPTDDSNANLGMILNLKGKYPDNIIGYSDHTLPKDMKTLELATLFGAEIIEKHFTFDKQLPGNDHYHSMDMCDLKVFHNILNRNKELIGSFNKTPLITEEVSRANARRSLVANRNIEKGAKITLSDLTFKRPASGISPKDYEDVIVMYANENIKINEIISWEQLSEKGLLD